MAGNSMAMVPTSPSAVVAPTAVPGSPIGSGRNIDFEMFLEHGKNWGQNGQGTAAWYISFHRLEDYWNHSALDQWLNNAQHRPIPANATNIVRSYLRVWSILVYIGRPDYIEDFMAEPWDDDNLPMKPDGGPSIGTKGTNFINMLAKFRENQWPFVPVRFETNRIMEKRHLDNRAVLPIEHVEYLTNPVDRDPFTVIKRVVLREDCSNAEFPKVSKWPNIEALLPDVNGSLDCRVQGISDRRRLHRLAEGGQSSDGWRQMSPDRQILRLF